MVKLPVKYKIIEDLYRDKEIERVLMNIPLQHRSEIKQYLFEKILEMPEVKIIKLNSQNKLVNYFKVMLWNQWNPNRSHKLKDKNVRAGYWKFNATSENHLNSKFEEDSHSVSIYDDKKDKWDIMLEYFTSENNDGPFSNSKLDEILGKFYYINKNSINYFFNRKVFELYYFEGMNYLEISKKTRISYEAIRTAVNFTLDFVKNEVKKINFDDYE